MKKYFTLLAFLLFAYNSFCQRTVLWRVSFGDSATSWLMGTNHAAPLAILELQPKIYDAYTHSSTIFFETNFDKMDEDIAAYYSQRPVNPFWATVSAADSTVVAENFNRKKIDYSKLSAGEAALYLAGVTSSSTNCFNPSYDLTPLDFGLFEKAKAESKSLRFLEPVTYQLEVLEKLAERFNENIGKKLLSMYVKKLQGDDHKPDCKRVIRYVNMDVRYNFRKMPAVPAVALLDRNNNWMKILPDSLKMGNCFVAVGLAHLDGSKGLIKQLQDQGFSVEPILLEPDRAKKLLTANQ